MTGFSPLGSSSYVELDMATKSDSALDEPVVSAIATKHGKSPAQVRPSSKLIEIPCRPSQFRCTVALLSLSHPHPTSHANRLQVLLRWGVQTGASVIPKSVKLQRLVENLDIFGFSLTDEDIEQLSMLEQNRRFNDPGEFTQGMNSFCPIYD